MRVVFIKKIYIAAVVAASKREFTLIINEHCAVVSRNAVLIAGLYGFDKGLPVLALKMGAVAKRQNPEAIGKNKAVVLAAVVISRVKPAH